MIGGSAHPPLHFVEGVGTKYLRTGRVKWNGSLTDLKSFVELVLKLKGKWTGKKSGGKQTFQGDKVFINWWPSKKTLHVQGSPDFTEQVEEQLDNLHKDFKQKVASNDYGKRTRKNNKKKDQEKLETGILSQNIWSNESPTKVKELNRSQPVQRQIEAIWSQLLEIKQLVVNQAKRLESSKPSASVVKNSQVKTIYSDPSIITGAPGADLQCEQAKKICTKAGNTNLITNYFEQTDKKKNDGQVSKPNKVTNLHANIERIEKEKMKLIEQVESLGDENYKLKKRLKEVQKDNGNEKRIDNKENNHVEKGKIQVKGKDKEAKTATKLSKKKEPDDNIQKPGRAYQELNKESVKRQLVGNKERQSKQQQQQQWKDNQTSDKNDKPYVIIAGYSLTKGFSGATTQNMKDYIKPLVAKKTGTNIFTHWDKWCCKPLGRSS